MLLVVFRIISAMLGGAILTLLTAAALRMTPCRTRHSGLFMVVSEIV